MKSRNQVSSKLQPRLGSPFRPGRGAGTESQSQKFSAFNIDQGRTVIEIEIENGPPKNFISDFQINNHD